MTVLAMLASVSQFSKIAKEQKKVNCQALSVGELLGFPVSSFFTPQLWFPSLRLRDKALSIKYKSELKCRNYFLLPTHLFIVPGDNTMNVLQFRDIPEL